MLLTENKNLSSFAHAVTSHEWQDKVHKDPNEFQALLDALDVAPAIDSLQYIVTFITPKIEKRRFDTSFFFAVCI